VVLTCQDYPLKVLSSKFLRGRKLSRRGFFVFQTKSLVLPKKKEEKENIRWRSCSVGKWERIRENILDEVCFESGRLKAFGWIGWEIKLDMVQGGLVRM
jgi:hypothetical protein